ncbi:BamA/OMP85 family outer membrane protein [Roseimaritima ulvae]|uniref:Outer membrane protein assembly factor BamA n=1 Tax=Roseimaritima ulvae TaxID=980254 RepID=A0A5B9QLF5_9BACT|nr:POTRA domain-containing protein [Roseimaritima ulvae]QEG38849.1 Outer membrane protein assembly factor BamA precursor [Roseimaritima ulvae]
MPQWLALFNVFCFTLLFTLTTSTPSHAQMGGGGMGGSGGGAPPPNERARFREHVHDMGGLRIRRESGDTIVTSVEIRGNRFVGTAKVLQLLETRPDRLFDEEMVLSDIRKLNEFGAFSDVRYRIEDRPEGKHVIFEVVELPTVSDVVYFGNRGLNDRELRGRSGVQANDPLNEFTIESAVRRLEDYYREQGFNNAVISSQVGHQGDPRAVVFRISEGVKERIHRIRIVGNQIEGEARLKKVIRSRDSFMRVGDYIGNTANLQQIDADVDILTSYYRNLGFLRAHVSRLIEYDETGKWLNVTFVVVENERYIINDIKIVGNQFVPEEQLRERLTLKPGEFFSGMKLNLDTSELMYSYGTLGFIYCEVEPQPVMRDEPDRVDLVFKINEGDRWKIGQIFVNIEGEPHLMRETMLLNQLDLVEGQYIDRRKLESGRNVLNRLQLFETNPTLADAPDIKVVPQEDSFDYEY